MVTCVRVAGGGPCLVWFARMSDGARLDRMWGSRGAVVRTRRALALHPGHTRGPVRPSRRVRRHRLRFARRRSQTSRRPRRQRHTTGHKLVPISSLVQFQQSMFSFSEWKESAKVRSSRLGRPDKFHRAPRSTKLLEISRSLWAAEAPRAPPSIPKGVRRPPPRTLHTPFTHIACLP
jgi:hypothetical protein